MRHLRASVVLLVVAAALFPMAASSQAVYWNPNGINVSGQGGLTLSNNFMNIICLSALTGSTSGDLLSGQLTPSQCKVWQYNPVPASAGQVNLVATRPSTNGDGGGAFGVPFSGPEVTFQIATACTIKLGPHFISDGFTKPFSQFSSDIIINAAVYPTVTGPYAAVCNDNGNWRLIAWHSMNPSNLSIYP